MEEDNVKELPTENGVYTEIVDSVEIPKFLDEEADDREYETLLKDEEGGK